MKNHHHNLLTAIVALVFAAFAGSAVAQEPNVKVEGKPFKAPANPNPKSSKDEYDKQLAILAKQKHESPVATTKGPADRRRGNVVSPDCFKNGYYGTCAIYQFVNEDFPTADTTCGQSALATAMWAVGIGPTYRNSHEELVKAVWSYAPPKITLGGLVNMGGGLGTDWRQMVYGADGFKRVYPFNYQWVKGFDAVKAHLRQGHPVVIMLDCGTLKQYGFGWGGGHWVVAYGYDSQYIYVTNFENNRMTWNELKVAWGGDWFQGNLAKAHGTAEMGMAFWK